MVFKSSKNEKTRIKTPKENRKNAIPYAIAFEL
jgi:hypothetical protein